MASSINQINTGAQTNHDKGEKGWQLVIKGSVTGTIVWWGFMMWLSIISILFDFFIWILGLFAIVFGVSPDQVKNNIWSKIDFDFVTLIAITVSVGIILFLVTLVLTIVSRNKLKKISFMKKQNNMLEVGFKVKKIYYLLAAWFLGAFGVHHFVARNHKKGIIILVFHLLGPIILFILGYLLNANFLLLLLPVPILITMGLALSDILIAGTKIKDENNQIIVS